LGNYLVEAALQLNYNVIAGVNTYSEKSKLEKIRQFDKLFKMHPNSLEIRQFSLKDIESIKDLLKDSDCVIHCASVNYKFQ